MTQHGTQLAARYCALHGIELYRDGRDGQLIMMGAMESDNPWYSWIPTEGTITFKMLSRQVALAYTFGDPDFAFVFRASKLNDGTARFTRVEAVWSKT